MNPMNSGHLRHWITVRWRFSYETTKFRSRKISVRGPIALALEFRAIQTGTTARFRARIASFSSEDNSVHAYWSRRADPSLFFFLSWKGSGCPHSSAVSGRLAGREAVQIQLLWREHFAGGSVQLQSGPDHSSTLRRAPSSLQYPAKVLAFLVLVPFQLFILQSDGLRLYNCARTVVQTYSIQLSNETRNSGCSLQIPLHLTTLPFQVFILSKPFICYLERFYSDLKVPQYSTTFRKFRVS